MPLLSRKRIITAKIETTYGTDSSPIGANAILAKNINLTPQDADLVDRDLIRPYLGRSEQLPAAIRAMLEFEVEVQGSGAAGTAPGYGALLRACGFSETISAGTSVTYAPVSASFESVSIYVNVDGVLHKLTGARGTVSIGFTVKQIPTYKFKFTGLYNTVTDTAAVTPVYTTFQTPLTVSAINTPTFALHGVSPALSELSIDLSNDLVHRTLVGQSEQVLLTNRQAQGSATIEAGTIAFKDWFTLARNATLGVLNIIHGTTAGFKVQIQSSRVQLTKPGYQDMDGVQMLQMGLNFVPSSSGNDELSITVL